jgi:hypothetical protein
MAAGSTYTQISSQTLSSDTATVTFSSIPQTYTDLRLVVSSRVDGGYNSGGMDVYAYYNSDQGSNYSNTQMYGNGSSYGSNRSSNITYSYVGVSSNTSSGSDWPIFATDIMNYTNTSAYKTTLSRLSSPNGNTFERVILWRSTAAISSFTLYPELSLSFKTGSTFSLYGIKAA